MIPLTEAEWKIIVEEENRNGRMCYADDRTENWMLQSILIGHERRKRAEEQARLNDLFFTKPRYQCVDLN